MVIMEFFAIYNTFFFIVAILLFLIDEINKALDNRFISVIGRVLIPAWLHPKP